MLRLNDSNGSFILYTDNVERAEAAGLALSTNIRGPNGEKVYFTSDHKHAPTFNPYAVLEFYDQADDATKEKLYPLKRDYDKSWLKESDTHIPVPDDKELMPFQKAGVAYALEKGNCIIGDSMGTGKTVQAIGVANAIDARKVLVLCPASIRLNWRREISEWSTLRKPTAYPILKGSDGVHPSANYTICSYDLTRNQGIHSALTSMEWDLIICDEGHYLKSIEAQRTRAVFGGGERGTFFYENGLDRHTDRIIALTGTPLPNRPREAYTLARGLNWESIDYLSHDAFQFRYNSSIQFGKHTEEVKGRLPELNARLRSNLMVRRLKKDVMPQLPDKRYEMTYIEPDGAIKKVLAKEALIDFDPHEIYSSDFKLDGTPVSTLRREMGEAMVSRVVDYMKYLLDIVEVPKVILYAHHTSVIMALAEYLQNYGVVLHRGGMSDAKKEASKHEFMHGHPRIFLGQLDTMEGVDGLQHSTGNVVFAEPAWTPGRNEQCVDRAHRHGQHDNVIAHFLLAEGSFNEKVLNVVLDKAEDIHESLDRKLV